MEINVQVKRKNPSAIKHFDFCVMILSSDENLARFSCVDIDILIFRKEMIYYEKQNCYYINTESDFDITIRNNSRRVFMIKQPNMKIRKFTDSDFDAFAQMVGVYFIEDLKDPLNNNPPVGMCKAMTQNVKAGIIYLDLLLLDDTPIGFIMYQVDSPKSNWCEKEGYGFIREMYIHKDHRKQGYGKIVVAHAESELKKLFVPYIYLTSSNDPFWLSVGYANTGEICEKNNHHILIKES